MAKALAIRILRAHKDEIARRIVREVDRFAPGMQRIDERARLNSVLALADACADALSTGNPKQLASLLRNLTRLRVAGGMSREDLLATSHCYLPSLRRIFLEVGPDQASSLSAYEVVEEAVLPVLVELGRIILSFEPSPDLEEPTNPGRRPPRRALQSAESPFASTESE